MPTASEVIDRTLDTLLETNNIAPILATSTQSFVRTNLFSFTQPSRDFINVYGWDGFVTIEDADPLSTVSKLSAGGKSMSSFRNMTSLEASQLIPKVRLYKVFVDGATRKQTRTVPIPFPDSPKQNIKSIMMSKGQRGDDIVLKSVSIDFKNQNPALGGRMVDVSMTLQMQSGESLTKERIIQKNPDVGFRYADLILRNRQTDPEKHDSDYYEVKLVVGYENPNQSIKGGLSRDLNEQQVTLILYLLDYNIAFEQNGIIELTLDYQGAVQSKLEKPLKYNIFKEQALVPDTGIEAKIAGHERDISTINDRLTQKQKENETLEAEISDLEKQIKPLQDVIDVEIGDPLSTADPLTREQEQLRFDLERQLIKKRKALANSIAGQAKISRTLGEKKGAIVSLQNEILFLTAKNRVQKFNRIMTNLFRKGKVYRTVIDKRDLLLYGTQYEKKIEKEAAAAREAGDPALALQIETESDSKRRSVTAKLEDQIKSGQRAKAPIGPRTEDAIRRAATAAGTRPLSEAEADALVSSNLSLNNESDAVSTDRGNKIIYWFYYGDLLQEAFELNNVTSKMKDDNIVPALGGFLLKDRNTVPMVDKLVSIPDLPITVDAFLDFFKANIINPGRDVYPCQEFIRDTVQRLVAPSVNAETFGTQPGETKTFKVTEFQLPGVKAGGEYVDPLSYSSPLASSMLVPSTTFSGGRRDIDSVLKKFSKSKLAKRPVKGIFSYSIMYAIDSGQSVSWSGNVREDVKRGIYHHYIGADRGLVKSVEFQKDQQPFIAEVQAERALSGGDKYTELWRNFMATINMVGNSMYYPGQYLYINPTVAGLGNPKYANSLSRKLGLGGYYLVLNVTNSISNNQWSTQVQAQWQSSPPA